MTSKLPDVTVAERLARFVAQLRAAPERIAADVRDDAARRTLDNFGCILFGLEVEPARQVVELSSRLGRGRCRVPGNATTSVTAAAFSYGVLAQSFEMNDLGVYVHPGACVLPACMAAVQEVDRPVSGLDFLAAVIAGYEVTVRVSECVGPAPELEIGWHTPAFHGAIGAAAAASVLGGLDEASIAQALVIAADLAGGGLMMARLGTDAKRLHCGRAAETGVLAWLLAESGMRSRLDTFEHPDWGYCRTLTGGAPKFDLAEISAELGSRFVGFSRTAIKYYPVGAEVLGVIDNIARLRKSEHFGEQDVLSVKVGTPRFFLRAAAHEFPGALSQIHFNIEYGAAMALVHDLHPVYESREVLELWMHGFADDRVRQVHGRIEHVVDDDLDRRNPYGIDSSVEVRLRDGRLLRERSRYLSAEDSRGTMRFAEMNDDRLKRKFLALSASASGIRSSFADRVLALAGEADVRPLLDTLLAVRR